MKTLRNTSKVKFPNVWSSMEGKGTKKQSVWTTENIGRSWILEGTFGFAFSLRSFWSHLIHPMNHSQTTHVAASGIPLWPLLGTLGPYHFHSLGPPPLPRYPTPSQVTHFSNFSQLSSLTRFLNLKASNPVFPLLILHDGGPLISLTVTSPFPQHSQSGALPITSSCPVGTGVTLACLQAVISWSE